MRQDVDRAGAQCPFVVSPAVMLQRWEILTFLHWSYDAAVVQRLLPPSLAVEEIDGRAWVGLVPFGITATAPGIPPVPWLSRFPETNVRTYVRDHEGRVGVWFFSLDAARLPAVIAARTTYRLPYFWSDMSLEQRDDVVAYSCRRRWPDGGATSSVTVRIGRPYQDDELTRFDHLLTARWVLFVRAGSFRRFARASHEPWPLHRAEVLTIDDHLVEAAGLPRPATDPLVHYSPGVVDVRIGAPQRYGKR